jgi:hypothetical protein
VAEPTTMWWRRHDPAERKVYLKMDVKAGARPKKFILIIKKIEVLLLLNTNQSFIYLRV